MKASTREEFEAIPDGRVARESSSGQMARDIIDRFVCMNDKVVELEESDFGNEYDFSDAKQRVKAASMIQNKLKVSAYRGAGIICRRKGNRIFLGYREELEPNKRYFR